MEDNKVDKFLPTNTPCQFPKLHVLDGDGRSASRGRGQNCVVLLNIIETALGRVIRALRTVCYSVCKGDRAKVGKLDIRAQFEILDDPLRGLTAKRSVGSQKLLHRLAVRQIFDSGLARSRGGRDGGESDDVSSRNSNVWDIVGRIGFPFIPRYSWKER
jgi:hypothetical protein